MPITFPHFSVLFFLLLVAVSPAAAQPSSTDPQDPNFNSNVNPSVGVVIIALVVSLFLLGFFSMYIRHCAGDSSSSSSSTNAATRLAAAARSRRAPRGLDAAVIESFPTFDYSSVKSLHIGKGALECAVCLNEFEDDETLRLIPKCDHVFHPECIDAWLVSHTTCPVCRADLTPKPNDATPLAQIDEAQPEQNQPSPNNDSIIDILPSEPLPSETELMDIPLNPAALPPLNPKLNRSRTRAPGRPRWLGKFARSNSTGHVAVKQWENMDRFTLRLPEDIRRQIMSGKLNRTTSCVALPREGSSRRGPRAGPPIPDPLPVGEGSSRGRLFGSWRFDRAARSDRWMFSLAPPFVSRAPSVRSPKVAASDGGSVHSSKAGDSVHVFTVADPNLPPV